MSRRTWPSIFKLAMAAAPLYLPAGLTGQDSSTVVIGQRVRVTPKRGTYARVGILEKVDSTYITLRQTRDSLAWVFESSNVKHLEVPQPIRSSKVVKGAAIGFVLGGIAFGVGGYMATKDDLYWPGIGAAILAPVGMGAGGVTGGLIGRFTQGWRKVPIPKPVPQE